MNEVVWSDPPPRRGRGAALDWFWLALMDNPGIWAEYPRQLKGGFHVPGRPGGRFEKTQRTIDGERKAWVRWVPEDAA